MSDLPLDARVVEIRADWGGNAAGRFLYGSGFLIAGRTVLTAAHVVAGSQRVWVRGLDKIEVPALVDPAFIGWPGERPVDGSQAPDLALLTLEEGDEQLVRWPMGRLDREHRAGLVDRVRAVGYPWFAEEGTTRVVRSRVDAQGEIPLGSRAESGLFSVQVRVAPPQREGARPGVSPWSGMSGAPVLVHGRLVGVVSEHAPRAGESTITMVPLTAIQATAGRPLWGPGVSDPTSWWARLGASGVDDLVLMPARAEADYWATLREFGHALHHRMPQLVGRERELAEIVSFASGPGGYRWLVGGAFTGKSALLYEAITAGLPGDVDVVSYFLSRRTSDADGDGFLAAVIPQLAILADVEPGAVNVHRFRNLWQAASARGQRAGRHLLLVVDGLDEDLRAQGAAPVVSLLPVLVGPKAHVLVSSRPQVRAPEDHPLATCVQMKLDGFAGWEELRDLGRHEIDGLVNQEALPADLLGLLVAAAGPLSVPDLAALHVAPATPRAADRSPVRNVLESARSLEQVGPADQPGFQFAHASLFDHARSHEDLADPEFRNRILAWADEYQAAGWRNAALTPVPTYLLDRYPLTLLPRSDQDGDLGRLARITSDVAWVAVAVAALGVDAVLGTLRTASTVLTHATAGTSLSEAARQTTRLLQALLAQSYALRRPPVPDDVGFVLRQICLHSLAVGDGDLEAQCTTVLMDLPRPQLVPRWTTTPPGRLLARQVGTVVSVSVSADGSRTALSLGHHVQILDRDGVLLQTLTPGGWVRDAVISADGLWVAAVGSGLVLSVFDARTGDSLPSVLRTSSHSLALSADGRIVVYDREGPSGIGIWDVTSSAADLVPTRADHVGVSGDGSRVVTCVGDGQVAVWDAESARLVCPSDGHRAGVVGISSDGTVAVSGDATGALRAWDVTSGAALGTLTLHHDRIRAIDVDANGSTVVAGDEVGRLVRWSPTTGAATSVFAHLGAVSAVAVTGKGERILSGGTDGTAWDWGPVRSAGAGTQDGAPSWSPSHALAIGESVVVAGGPHGLRVRDLQTGEAVRDLTCQPEDDPLGQLQALAVSSDGSTVVAGGIDPRVLVWGPTADTPSAVLRGHRSGILAVAATKDGRLVFAGDQRGDVVAWDVRSSSSPHSTFKAGGAVTALAVTPDGGWLVCGTDWGEVWRWAVASGAGGKILEDERRGPMGFHISGPVSSITVSPDGKLVRAVQYDGTQRTWSVGGGPGPVQPRQVLNSKWTIVGDGTEAVLEDHAWLHIHPTTGPSLPASTTAPATAIAIGAGTQGSPTPVALAHPGGAITLLHLIG